jgi:hypothetical protein
MKKISTVATLTAIAVFFTSCTKTSSELVNPALPNLSSSSQASAEVNVVSKWNSPYNFYLNIDRLNRPSMVGICPYTTATQLNYDKNTHVELAYARIPTGQRIPYIYKRIPLEMNVTLNGSSAAVTLDFSLDPDGLKLYFKNSDVSFLSRAVDQTTSENWNFRYIVMPKAKYESTIVDWNNLTAVATALNFTL